MEVREYGLGDGKVEEPVNLGRLVVPRASLAKWLEAKKGANSGEPGSLPGLT
jgi:hypothetical protein